MASPDKPFNHIIWRLDRGALSPSSHDVSPHATPETVPQLRLQLKEANRRIVELQEEVERLTTLQKPAPKKRGRPGFESVLYPAIQRVLDRFEWRGRKQDAKFRGMVERLVMEQTQTKRDVTKNYVRLFLLEQMPPDTHTPSDQRFLMKHRPTRSRLSSGVWH